MKIGDLGDITGSAYLETGVRMHYVDAGAGTAALVLLHGFPQTSWQWRHVIEPFAEAGYRVIAPDYRGAGNSSRPRSTPASRRISGERPSWPEVATRSGRWPRTSTSCSTIISG
jgi:pimeloyl-ACP methyl ester carboxylesterase